MKHLKTFEDNNFKYNIGDYVICKFYNDGENHELNIFLKNNIGQIIDITKYLGLEINKYIIQFDNIPKHLNWYKIAVYDSSIQFTDRDIVYCTKDKSELEMMINSKKFNL